MIKLSVGTTLAIKSIISPGYVIARFYDEDVYHSIVRVYAGGNYHTINHSAILAVRVGRHVSSDKYIWRCLNANTAQNN